MKKVSNYYPLKSNLLFKGKYEFKNLFQPGHTKYKIKEIFLNPTILF